jgi:2-dehydro-3-deoxyglucarate aldolase
MVTVNPLREAMEDGTALGVVDATYSERVTELLGRLGYDFVWLDLEHGGPSPYDGDALERFDRAARAGGAELLVRVPEASGSMVRKVLDAGVRSLFVSRVDTAEQAREVTRAARFTYHGEPGERGMASQRSSGWAPDEGYPARADRAVTVGVTIETRDGVENVEDICATPELGFVFAGPLDLSVAHGAPGDREAAGVHEGVERVYEAATAAGLPVGNLAFGVADAREKREQGYDLLNVGSSMGAVRAGLGDTLERLR